MKTTTTFFSLAVSLLFTPAQAGDMLVIGNGNVPKMDTVTVQKIYSGKFISVVGVNVTPVALKTGTPLRNRFLKEFLNQNEEKYTAYWTVRLYIGKGTPPMELGSTSDVIGFVQATPGAVGYIDANDVQPGMNVIAR